MGQNQSPSGMSERPTQAGRRAGKRTGEGRKQRCGERGRGGEEAKVRREGRVKRSHNSAEKKIEEG